MLLSAVSFNGGTLEFSADAGDADDITVSAPSPSTLQFVVGNGDSITLAPDIAADANFTLSSGDTVLDVNIGLGGISLTDVEFFLDDGADSLTFESFVTGVNLSADGGSGNDSIDASAIDGSVVLVGGTGNDLLIGGNGNDALIGGSGDDELRGGPGEDNLVGGGQIDITITNLQTTDGALLTPFFVATSNGTYDFFNVGSAASASLEALAEDGTTGPRIDGAIASGGVGEAAATSGGPLAPGESRTISLQADSLDSLTQYLSFASMVIPSNDAFIGNDDPQAIPLFDAQGDLIERVGNGAFVVTGDNVYDAGTEVNDEIPANTAALAQAAPNTGVDENGVITQHPGFIGSVRQGGGAAGSILTARPNADFTDGNPQIASIEITSNDGNDLLIGGSGNDTIEGGRGDDTLIGGFGDDDLSGGDGDDTIVGGGQIEVTVTNLQQTDGALLTPFFLSTTNGVYDVFDVGSAASGSLEALAEDGNTAPRITAALNSGGVDAAIATPGGPLAPGDARTVTFYATSTNALTQYLSFASMVIPSNDAFIGNDDPLEIDLFDADGNLIQRVGDGAFFVTGDNVYDAGTEVNDEIPANTAALAQAAPNTGVDENGVITQHPGFIGSVRQGGGAAGNVLTARPNGDFTDGNPQIASIQIGGTLDGNDTINGGAGNDTILGSEGDDNIIGGDGDDTVDGGLGNDTIFGNTGIDTLTGNYGDDTIVGGSGDDVLTGNAGNDTIFGGFGDDDIDGGDGDDTLVGGGQIEVTVTNLQATDGGLLTPFVLATQNDTYDFFNVGGTASGSLEALAEDGNTGPRIEAALNSGGVFAAVATPGGLLQPGDSRTVTFYANPNNPLTQNLSFASMFLPSNDAFIGNDDPTAIPIFDDAGNLIIRTGDDAFFITGDDVYDAGTEVNDEAAATTPLLGQAAPNTGTTENGVIRQHPGLIGSVREGGDTLGGALTFSPAGDFTDGNPQIASIQIGGTLDGDDTINGGAGNDTILGSEGDDNIIGGDGDDTVDGGLGNDTIFGNTGIDTLTGNYGDDTIVGGSGDDVLTGNAGNDTIFGGFGDDDIDGGDGDDTLVGGGQIEVTVTNLQATDGGLLTPFVLATQNDTYDFFNVGGTASGSLEALAEDGNTGPRIEAALNSGGVFAAVATPGGLLQPGDSRTVTFYANPNNPLTQNLSFASMFLPSNDAFIGNDDPTAIPIFDDAGNLIIRTGDDAFFITGDDVYDAGTEVNDEAAATTPLLGQAAPNTGTTENGVIRQHPGLIGSVREGGDTLGGALTFSPAGDFTDGNPQIASIQIGGTLDGNDTINGGAGDDTILGSEGDDNIIGGDGDDTVDGGIGNDTIFGNTGIDTLTGNYGDDTIVGGSGDDVLTGNAGNDTIFGGFGDDDIDGGDGDDTLVGGGQIEVTVTNLQATDGGLLTPFVLATQNDTYDFFNVGGTASGSLEALAEDGNTGPRIEAALNSGGVFAAVATPGGLLQPGDSRTVTFYANPNNPLTQNLSFASMFLPSNDAFIGNDDPTAIPIFDDAGNLIIRTGDDAFFITGDDVYDAGTEVNDEAAATTPLLGQAAPNTGDTEGGVIRQHPGLIGSVREGGDTLGGALTFSPAGDFTDGNPQIASIQIGGTLDGDDTINGGAGNDTILGSEGDDNIIGGDGDDTVDGGLGNDTIFGNTGIDTLTGNYGDDTIVGGSGDDVLTGNAGNDTIFGGFGDDDIDGGDGDDTLVGGGQIEVTVTNLQATDGGLLTPFVLATQNDTYDFFNVGGTASGSLEALAEDGNTGPRIEAALNSGGVFAAVATPGGLLQPGDSRTVTFYANPNNPLTQNLSFASMFLPSNDAFIGNDDPTAIPIFDDAGNLIIRTGDDAFFITGDDVYDAGTEVNDEAAATTPLLGQAAPNTGTTEGGVIRQHPGLIGSVREGGDTLGGALMFSPAGDFTDGNPQIASIQIGGTLDGDDTINGGAGDDTILGSEGDDNIIGGDGDDTVDGGLGNDTIFGNTGIDTLTGNYGDDTIVGGSGDDVLTGNAGNDTIFGGFGDDDIDGGDGDDTLVGGGQIEVTVTNLQATDGGLLTPFVLATQNDTYDFFNVGGTASGSLEALAEDGNTGPRIEAALNSGGVFAAVATPGGLLQPGDSRTVTFYANPNNPLTQNLSFASMFLPSNDAFIGNDDPTAIPIFDDAGNLIIRTGDDAFFITGDDVYDAGTEVNDEAAATTPLLGQAAPNTGTTENGVIRQHPGLIGSVREGGDTLGGALTFSPAGDFTDGNPQIASIQIGGTLDGNDTINGGAGDDTILGSEGDDNIIGGDGDDTVDGGIGNDTIFGNTGIDTLTGNYGDDTIVGGSGDDVLTGNAGNDTIFGGFGDDDIDGGDGDDTLVGGGQIEVTVTNLQATDGGLLTPFVLATQNDTYDFFNVGGTASGSLEALAEDGNTGPRIEAALNSGGVFAAVATPGGLLQPGDSRTVTFYANPNNPLTQNLSFASMFLPSNDAFIGNDDPTAIPIFDDAGNLIIRTGDDAFFITGDDVYDAGTEVNDEAAATTPLLGQAAPNTGDTEGGVIRQHPGLIGSVREGGDTLGGALTFSPAGDFTDGNPQIASIQIGGTLDGDDTINGGAGNDTILGSEGDDNIIGGDGDDTVDGGLGNDTIFGNTGIDTLTGNYGDDTIVGGSGDDVLTGNAGNDTIFGGFGDDDIDGGDGDDTLVGGGQIEVTVTNLQATDGGLLTPFVLATQNDTYDFFNVGGTASGSLEALAEDGNTGPRIEAALNSGGVFAAVATPGGLLQPGDSRTVTFYANPNNPLTQNLSFASMFLPSNDAFIGNDDPTAIPIFDDAGNLIIRTGDDAFFITGDDVYDAGTEVNDEAAATTPLLGQAAPNTGTTEGGVIRQHPGLIGSVREGGDTLGGALMFSPAGDFTDGNPQIASIQIGGTLDGDDTINGGAGDDTILGSEGDDNIIGGLGNDTIVGGIGNDTVVLSGTRSQYSVDGISRVTDTVGSRDGADELTSVGTVEFSDATFVLLAISPTNTTTTTNPIQFTFEFGEAVTGFDVSDVSVTNGSAGTLTAVDANTYTLDVTPRNQGNVTVSVATGAADSGGTANIDESASVTSDVGVPTINGFRRFPGVQPTITWDAVQGSASYEIWVARITPAQSRILINESIVTTNSWTPAAGLDPAVYRVWVRSQGGDWSASQDFEVQPTLITPLAPTFSDRPTFRWNPIPNASGYEIFVRTRDQSVGVNGDIVVDNIPANETSWTPTVDLPEGEIRWWIRATDSIGNTGWSEVGLTDVSARAIVTAASETNIVWSDVVGAGRYILHVEEIGTRNVVIRENQLTATSFAPQNLASGSYRAWVKAIDAATDDFNSSPWSDAFDFTVAANGESNDLDSLLNLDMPELLVAVDHLLEDSINEPAERLAEPSSARTQMISNLDGEQMKNAAQSTDAELEVALVDALLSDPMAFALALEGPDLS